MEEADKVTWETSTGMYVRWSIVMFFAIRIRKITSVFSHLHKLRVDR